MFKTDRFTLRATRREDMEVQWTFENNAELFFLDGGVPQPTSIEFLYKYFDDNAQHPRPDGVSFAIEADGQYIGHCGLYNIQVIHRACELSIEIGNSDYWGKGYGREIIKLLLTYAFEHRNMNRVSLGTHAENERAIRCYRTCGFVEEGRFRQSLWLNGHYVDGIAMAILREDFYQ